MKKLAIALAFVAGSLAGIARAEIGTIDPTPAATLLLPYFEVDLANPQATNTIFTVNNASESAAVAHVTLWTDQAIPTFTFDIYLTGYDSQTVNLSTLFVSGALPQTADNGTDTPQDTISPKGPLSQDISFPGATGPCNAVYPDPSLSAVELRHLQRAHTGKSSPSIGGCAAAKYGDTIARGYATIDSATTCSLAFPSDQNYFQTVADNRNILWGDYNLAKGTDRTGKADVLVPIESCDTPGIGNGAGYCPFGSGGYTFYGRYTGDGSDQREPLPTTFMARYTRTGAFDGTDLVVWRDTKSAPTGANGGHACSAQPAWYPLSQTQVAAFDETENPTVLCFLTDNISPVVGGVQSCFPLATQKVNVFGGNKIAANLGVPYQSGFLYLNLNHTLAQNDPFPGLAQSWVSVNPSLSGRYATGYQAVPLDNVITADPGGVLIPIF